MTSDDVMPAPGGTTRRALRARAEMASLPPAPTLPFSDAAGAAPAVDGDVDEDLGSSAGEDPDLPAQPELEPGPQPELEPGLEPPIEEDPVLQLEESAEPAAEWADTNRPATALTWVEEADVEAATEPGDLDAATSGEVAPDLLADAKLRPELLHARWLVPIGALLALAGAYSATTLMWPLHEVPPVVEAVEFATVPSDVAEITWPTTGSAGLGVAGVSSAASSADLTTIASVTKVVSTLMVLDRMPLQLGEQGPEFAFTYRDNVNYWDYRRSNQSALDVPVDGVLTEYQLLQGTLLGSANNYIDHLAREIWGSDEQFARAAEVWLAERGLSDIRVVTPSGFDEGNVATPEALLRLGERAMQNPVFAEIVGQTGAEIPGAGWVENTNGMLADPGVVGIKTGSLVGYNLLTAKDVSVGDTTVRLYASVLNQDSDEERLAATRSLFSQAEAALATTAPAVPAGTVVGEVSTPWGTTVEIISDEDAAVVLWNGSTATAEVVFDLGDKREDGDDVGTLTVNGELDAATVDVSLAEELAGPSPWWRLTHPLELLGITDD